MVALTTGEETQSDAQNNPQGRWPCSSIVIDCLSHNILLMLTEVEDVVAQVEENEEDDTEVYPQREPQGTCSYLHIASYGCSAN